MRQRTRWRIVALILAIHLPVAAACSRSPEVQKQRFLESGNLYFDQRKYREALIEYRNAVQVDERFGPARLRLAQTYERLRDPASALSEYIRAADVLPGDTKLQLLAGNYLLAAKRFDDAKARGESVLRGEPRNVEAQILVGNASAGLRNIDQAVVEIEEAIRLDPGRGATYASLGALELSRGRAEAAEAAFTRAVSLDPKFVPGYLALANLYWTSGRSADAERELHRALVLEPPNAIANRALALLYLSTNRTNEAEAPVRTLAASGASPLALADLYLLQRRPSDAIVELLRLRANPSIAREAGWRLAQAYATKGDRTAAHAVADELLREDSKDARSLFLKGQLLVQDGKRDDALARFQAATAADPNSAEMQFALGRSYADQGDLDSARRAFNEVLRLNPRAGIAQGELARLDLRSGRVNSSVQFAKEAIRNEPHNLDAQVTLVRGLVASRDFAGAGKVLGPLLQAHPKLAALHVQRALILAAQNNPAEARHAMEEALRLDPESIEAISGLVSLDLASGKNSAARARIAVEVKTRPDRAELWLIGARVEVLARDFPAAERSLIRATQLDPTLLAAFGLLSQVYVAQGKLDEARRGLEALIYNQPKSVAALTMLGMIAQARNDTDTARTYYKRAIDVDGGAPVAANNLAWLDSEAGENLEQALQLAQVASRALPKVAEVKDTLGWVHYKRQSFPEAIKALEAAVALAPDNASYYYHLGLACHDAGDSARARWALQRAINLNPSFPDAPDARRLLAKLDLSGGSPVDNR